jgi:hypothetical protein
MIPNNAASIVAFGLAVHALTPAAAAQAQDETTTAIGDQLAAASANAYLWPQDVTSNGKTYRVFQPRVTGLDGARAYLVTQVSMTGADGKPTTGEALLQAEVMTSDVPGEVELNQFTVRSFTIDGKPATVGAVLEPGCDLEVVFAGRRTHGRFFQNQAQQTAWTGAQSGGCAAGRL